MAPHTRAQMDSFNKHHSIKKMPNLRVYFFFNNILFSFFFPFLTPLITPPCS